MGECRSVHVLEDDAHAAARPMVTRVSRRNARRRHPGRWIGVICLLLLALLGAVQFYAPRVAAAEVATALSQQLRVHPQVSVRAPIWMLMRGSFIEVRASAADVPTSDIRLAAVNLSWRLGQISLPDAFSGRLRVLRLGHLTAQMAVQQSALQQALDTALRGKLPKGVQAASPKVNVTAEGIAFSGKVTIDKFTLPYRLVGRLVLTSGGRGIAFLPESFEGTRLNVGPLSVLQLRHVIGTSPFVWRISSVHLATGRVLVDLDAIAISK